MDKHKYTNKLINQKSPYLLQHAHNPVNWFPWGEEAFEEAAREDKPIFLSIGYSTCHWCHVMERESFEDEEVAEILNNNFISIKVDREERPDIDNIYMGVCQALTGQGGWPLTILMSPDKKPFFAGTYFPKHNRMGLMGLVEILNNIIETWSYNKDIVIQSGEDIIKVLQAETEEQTFSSLSEKDIEKAFNGFSQSFDDNYGGFGFAPKFPAPHNLMFLLRYWNSYKNDEALKIVEKTLESMYLGGIFDHIGYGFSRYSTDNRWLVPHFEKMLYDNALLSIAYLEAYQATKKSLYKEIAEKIFTYVLRDMTSPEGAFYSAEDADSEGEEGKFYIWTIDEIEAVLGASDTQLFCNYYNITPKGNFEESNIPNMIETKSDNFSDQLKARIESCRQSLLDYRNNKRIKPYKDDKILTSWNGLMIAALAFGSRVTEKNEYLVSAEKAAEFIMSKLKDSEGRLLARYRDGESAYLAYLEDYAFLIWGLIELYEASHKPEYLRNALDLNKQLIDNFWDNDKGGLFLYGKDSEQLFLRPKESFDSSTPSGNSVSTLNFLRLARLSGNFELEDYAKKQFAFFSGIIKRYPMSHAFFLCSFSFVSSKPREIIIVGESEKDDTTKMIKTINNFFLPEVVFHVTNGDIVNPNLKEIVPFIDNQKSLNHSATAYICENFACQAPITNLEQLEQVIRQ